MKPRYILWAVIIGAFLWMSFSGGRIGLVPEPSLSVATAIRKPFTAREGEQEAKGIARRWAADAFLDCIRSTSTAKAVGAPEVALDGRPTPPNGWTYRFVSRSRGRSLWLTLLPDGTCEAGTQTLVNHPDSLALPPEMLDSPAILEIAEARFGKSFRGEGGRLVQLTAQVTTAPALYGEPRDPSPNRPTWQLLYIIYDVRNGRTDRRDLHLNLDAVTGEVLTVMEVSNDRQRVLFSKHQNSPR